MCSLSVCRGQRWLESQFSTVRISGDQIWWQIPSSTVRHKLGVAKKETTTPAEVSGQSKLCSWSRGCAWKSEHAQEVLLVSILRQVVTVSFSCWLWADLTVLVSWLAWKRTGAQEMKEKEERGHSSKGKRSFLQSPHSWNNGRLCAHKGLLGGELQLLCRSLTKWEISCFDFLFQTQLLEFLIETTYICYFLYTELLN